MIKIPFLNNEKGLSLVEIMMVVGLSAMVAYVVFRTTHYGNEQINAKEIRMSIQDQAREGLYKMVQEIRQSAPSRITIGGGGNSLTFSVPDPSNLVNADYTTNWTSAHTINYALSGTQIIRTDQTSGKTAVIANDVNAVDFSGNAAQPNVVTVTMSVQKRLTNGQWMPANPLQVTGQAEVRNN